MTDTNANADLSAEELAYFESGGETELPAPATEPGGDDAAASAEAASADSEQPPAEGQPGERDEKGRYVPHQALHAEREEHKKTKAQLEEISKKQAVLEDRWNTILKLREQGQQPAEPETPPDPETDIFGYAKWQEKQLKELHAKLDNREKAEEQARTVAEQDRAIWSDWENSAKAYVNEAPEFSDAVKWLSDTRTAQLSAFAAVDPRFSTPAGVNAQIDAELKAIIVQAKQAGVSPAKFVHDLARSWGFKPTASGEPKMPDKLAGIAQAQEAAKTVGQAPGRAGGDALTAEAIAAMSPEEFDRWHSDPKNARLLEKMMGA